MFWVGSSPRNYPNGLDSSSTSRTSAAPAAILVLAERLWRTPDGYTILVTPPSYVINPALYEKVPYDARTSFDPVTLAVSTTVVLAVHPSVPAQTFKELIALIKTNPGKYNYATAGVGSPGHMVGEMLRQSLSLDLVHIPYNSAGLAIGSVDCGPYDDLPCRTSANCAAGPGRQAARASRGVQDTAASARLTCQRWQKSVIRTSSLIIGSVSLSRPERLVI